jgi:hypothetical protein
MKRNLLIITTTLFGAQTAAALWQSGGNFIEWHVEVGKFFLIWLSH